jgi:uncharacterized membrane protein
VATRERQVADRDPEIVEEARRQAEETRSEIERRNPNWAAQLTVLVAILLGILLPSQLTIGAPWVVPACEAVLLVGLFAWTPREPESEDPRGRLARIALVGIVSAVNVFSLFVLTDMLLDGGQHADGRSLLIGGAVLWLTLVLLFAVWFWELDRGGPIRRMLGQDRQPDFLFPQMSDDWAAPDDWTPGIFDYLYLSLNNAASFSPAETVPLTGQAKLLMALQTIGSLTTMTVVLAYAINNLG